MKSKSKKNVPDSKAMDALEARSLTIEHQYRLAKQRILTACKGGKTECDVHDQSGPILQEVAKKLVGEGFDVDVISVTGIDNALVVNRISWDLAKVGRKGKYKSYNVDYCGEEKPPIGFAPY